LLLGLRGLTVFPIIGVGPDWCVYLVYGITDPVCSDLLGMFKITALSNV
jgi:hypothetical protein